MILRNKKVITTILLLLSCLSSVLILSFTPPYKDHTLELNGGLDSLIVREFQMNQIPENRYRRYDIDVDSVFSRTVYRVQVPPSFSKTMFHYNLHNQLLSYELSVPAKVILPGNDMNIYILERGTTRSTIRLLTTSPEELENQ